MFTDTVQIEHLAAHPETLPIIKAWFEAEWSAWYRSGGNGDAEADLVGYANSGSLPFALITFLDDEPCGVAVLKIEPISG